MYSTNEYLYDLLGRIGSVLSCPLIFRFLNPNVVLNYCRSLTVLSEQSKTHFVWVTPHRSILTKSISVIAVVQLYGLHHSNSFMDVDTSFHWQTVCPWFGAKHSKCMKQVYLVLKFTIFYLKSNKLTLMPVKYVLILMILFAINNKNFYLSVSRFDFINKISKSFK